MRTIITNEENEEEYEEDEEEDDEKDDEEDDDEKDEEDARTRIIRRTRKRTRWRTIGERAQRNRQLTPRPRRKRPLPLRTLFRVGWRRRAIRECDSRT